MRELPSSKFLGRFSTVPKFVETQNVWKIYILPLRCVDIFRLLEQLWKDCSVMRLSYIVTCVSFRSTDEHIDNARLSNDIEKTYVGRESTDLMFSVLSKLSLFFMWPHLPLPSISLARKMRL